MVELHSSAGEFCVSPVSAEILKKKFILLLWQLTTIKKQRGKNNNNVCECIIAQKNAILLLCDKWKGGPHDCGGGWRRMRGDLK